MKHYICIICFKYRAEYIFSDSWLHGEKLGCQSPNISETKNFFILRNFNISCFQVLFNFIISSLKLSAHLLVLFSTSKKRSQVWKESLSPTLPSGRSACLSHSELHMQSQYDTYYDFTVWSPIFHFISLVLMLVSVVSISKEYTANKGQHL